MFKSAISLLALVLMLTLTACEAETPAPETTEPAEITAEAPPTPYEEKINLNTASDEDFRTIPGVGDRMVHEFEEYRPYVSIAEFRREIGKYVDEDQVATYEEYLFVPVDPNESDEATLQQIPGVDETVSAEIVNGRPYASNEVFLEKLRELIPAEEFAVAGTYLATP